MTIQQLYDTIDRTDFDANVCEGLRYNYYIYTYPAGEEYDIREQLEELEAQPHTAPEHVGITVINLFDEFCAWLDSTPFLRHPSTLRYLLDREQRDPSQAQSVEDTLARRAHSEEFLCHLQQRILERLGDTDPERRPFAILCGVGAIFPYLRVSDLLERWQDCNDTTRYRVLVCYPGEQEGNDFRLFGALPGAELKCATLTIN